MSAEQHKLHGIKFNKTAFLRQFVSSDFSQRKSLCQFRNEKYRME